jgi:hypothetical protein
LVADEVTGGDELDGSADVVAGAATWSGAARDARGTP